MAINDIARKVLLAAAAASLGGALATCSTEQPKILCSTAHGGYAVRYTLTSGSGPCAELKGGVMGVQSYVGIGANKNMPQFAKPPVAIKPAEIGDLIDAYKANIDPTKQAANGVFAEDKPQADNFCPVGIMSSVTLNLPARPPMPDGKGGMTPDLPAVNVSYELSNVKFYVSASVTGTVMTGDLKYIKDGCMATYHIDGVYPNVACERVDTVTGPDGKAMDKHTGQPREDLCDPCADPANGRATGSMISPDINVTCDKDSLLCAPVNAAPSLRATTKICAM
jgi:hypothetical protein